MNINTPIVDPTFLRDSNYSYVNETCEELTSVICFALAKKPADLILHQQRIELYSKKDNKALLFSALVDLFTALSNKGKEYKERMLDKYRNQLSMKHTLLLTKSISTGLPTTKVIQNLNESLLNLGLQGPLLSSNNY